MKTNALLAAATAFAFAAACGSDQTRAPAAPAAPAAEGPEGPAPITAAGTTEPGVPPSLPASADAVQTRAFRPERRDPTEERIARLRVPEGFRVAVFARDLTQPRMMALAADGSVLVTQPATGEVIRLRDADGDGRADQRTVAVADVPHVHGIAVRGDTLYVAPPKRVLAGTLTEGGVTDMRPVLEQLPDGGQHPNRTLAFGPDGKLYVSIGSSCNACNETNPEHATIVQANPDGSQRRIYARGLRNTIGFDWHPQTRQLWGMDHGSDHRGDDTPPEELNRLLEGGDYGWPYVYGKQVPDPMMDSPPNTTKEAYAEKTVPPEMTYQAHSAPIALVFYDGEQFPPNYRGDALVAMHGSWNRIPATGYEVARISFEDGQPTRTEPFLTGFLIEDGRAHFGRPAGLVVAADGSLLVSDDVNGVIYRVFYAPVARR